MLSGIVQAEIKPVLAAYIEISLYSVAYYAPVL